MRNEVALLGLVVALLAGCSTRQPCPPVEKVSSLPDEDVDSVLFLIGDAGEPDPAGEPVLHALRRWVARAVEDHGADRVLVVFLGDNIYPEGLPEAGDPEAATARRRLDAQIEVFEGLPQLGRPLGVFVPGNHDWGIERRDGLERIRRQAQRLTERGGGRVAMLPREGCPGPVALDVAERLRVIALDTHWWLRQGPKPVGPSGGCASSSEAAVTGALSDRIAEAEERHAVVVAHHPLFSGGPHGGTTAFWRRLGVGTQDIPTPRYQAMRDAVLASFTTRPPLLYAAGHEHSLQVLDPGARPFHVVSGAGSKKNLTPVGAIGGTLFCRQSSGFVRLQFTHDGRVRLGVFAAGDSARGSEVYSTFLTLSG